MNDFAIVTGAGSGIGRALALALADRDLKVIAVGRRRAALEETAAARAGMIVVEAADVATPEGRAAITSALPAEARLRVLVHNAAVLTPVGPLADVTLDDWRHAEAVNVEGPLFLTQRLLEPLADGGRVLHVSSGAAHSVLAGWGAYCTTKAALHMLYRMLRLELMSRGIAIGSFRPGVVDTPMQAEIRGLSEQAFPDVGQFVALKEQGELRSPEEVAAFACWLLLDTDAEAYSHEEWEVGDARYRPRR